MSEAGADVAAIKQAVFGHLDARTAVDTSRMSGGEKLLGQALIDSLQLIELIIWIEDQTGEPVESDQLLVDDDLSVDAIAHYIRAARDGARAAAA